MTEDWRPVPGFEGLYSVSNFGRVRSESRSFLRSNGTRFTQTGRVLRLTVCAGCRGYPKVALWKAGHQHDLKVHVLVAAAFIGPRPKDREIRHWDGVPTNCRADNLLYGTKLENAADRARHGHAPRGEACGTAKLKQWEADAIFESADPPTALAKKYGISFGQACAIRRGEYWQHDRSESSVLATL